MAPANGWRTFMHLLINTGVAGLTTNFIWFAVVFWVYLETQSILAIGILSGSYMLLLAACSMWFGSLVDRYRKHAVMLISAWCSLAALLAACAVYFVIPKQTLLDLGRPWFWIFLVLLLIGCVVELLRSLALSTTVTLLVPVERHVNANGLVGTVQGLSFIVTSVFSGLSIGFFGMSTTMVIAAVLTAIPIGHLLMLRVSEPEIVHDPERSAIDFKGGMSAIRAVPGLIGLVLFTTFNNLVSGAHMALIDPYGLTMFSPQLWGTVFGLAGTGYIVGGALVARFGLGRNPVRTMVVFVALLGVIGVFITIREAALLLIVGLWVFMLLMPAIEAAEQTVIQRVVPFEKQGRVFGLAGTFEAAAAPITAFLIAPLAEFWVVPYMASAAGQARWGWLLGEGESRGIAMIFLIVGLFTAILAVLALFTGTYRRLSQSYADSSPVAQQTEPDDPSRIDS